jgi:hypothetical protein
MNIYFWNLCFLEILYGAVRVEKGKELLSFSHLRECIDLGKGAALPSREPASFSAGIFSLFHK